MKKSSFDAIARALNEAQVPFLVVGGVAVISHGFGRITHDVDLVVRLEAGRPKDLADIDELSLISGEPSSYDQEDKS